MLVKKVYIDQPHPSTTPVGCSTITAVKRKSVPTTLQQTLQHTNPFADYMPLYTSEMEGFLHFSNISVLLHQTLTPMMKNKYQELSDMAKQKITVGNNFTLTCDMWTETNSTKGYL
ncbi:hypothetical protein PR048_014673 [Dryococelus australis]|uniref:Transposase n=1 Tax=Dryococelus australis TaxID=614101 RepID=A0ABQ9HF23_9NEOP|nr:hypothetical protein PR048_014673 [Dryococelus australis]